jgi:hypothetical protein
MCNYQGHEFGAPYPDSICIDGYLWDADKCDDNGNFYGEGDWPCPQCNIVGWREYHRDSLIEDAMVACDAGCWPFRNSKGGRLWGYAMQCLGIVEYLWDSAKSFVIRTKP